MRVSEMAPSAIVREPSLEAFLATLAGALVGHTGDRDAEPALAKIFDAMRSPRPPSRPTANRLPVCSWLAEAAATARLHSSTVASVVDSFLELEPRLRWATRASGGPLASENWEDGHANATIVGRGGLEKRDDAQIGV